MDVSVFGVLEISQAGRRIGPDQLGGRKPKQVLELLVAARGHPMSKDRLIDELWPEQPPRHPSAALENHVWVLRRHLPPPDPGAPPWIEAAAGTYRLSPRLTLDLDRFDELVQQAEREALPAGRPYLERAIALVRGEVFEDEPYADWAITLRQGYRTTVVRVLLDAAEAAAIEGDATAALRLAHRALETEPLSENACRLLMWAHAVRAEREQALRVYEAFHARLRAELRLQPLPGTVAVYERIRGGGAVSWDAVAHLPVRVDPHLPRFVGS